MTTSRLIRTLMPLVALMLATTAAAQECCLSGLFAGCGACFRKAPAYAVAPVMAPVAAPIAAAPPPVMVPVQQTSYVPETTYRTQYQNVPVTTYKPSCEIDPCTGCPVECMQPVTQYVQQAVNVPVTQYRAVTTTKYVQMQPGYGAPAPVGYPAAPALPGPATPAASPFATPTPPTPPPAMPTMPATPAPQGWGAAGSDVPQQLVPGQPSINPPALPPGAYPPAMPATGYPPMQVVPQAGTYAPQPLAPVQPQPTPPPALSPPPSLKPIPELPRTTASGSVTPVSPAPAAPAAAPGSVPPPSLVPGTGSGTSSPTAAPATEPGSGMPLLPGTGPTGATRAFPRLLEPTHHTTSWQPATDVVAPPTFMPAYPTAALPARLSR